MLVTDSITGMSMIVKGQRRAISHETHSNVSDIPTGQDSRPPVNLNQALLKQTKEPNIGKHLAKMSYLKYSAFSQLSNNEARPDEDDQSPYNG